MREEVISSGGTIDPTPAASSAGASSPAVPTNVGSIDWSSHGHGSKAASLSCIGSQQPRTSLSTSAGGSALGSSRTSCRPWERGDLLRRLATFKPSNWFGKPKVASSLACAQRGWINVDVDKIMCESCGAYLSFVSLPSGTPAEVDSAGEAFGKELDTEHKVNCPWRGNSCPESMVQFPPTPQSALIGGYKDRCDGLLQFQSLPIVAASAVEQMRASRGSQIERLLSQSQNFMGGEVDFRSESIPELEASRDGVIYLYSRAQKLISLCGWEPRWLPNVQDCEEHSAQSARNGCSFGPTQAQVHLSLDPGPSKNAVSASAKKDTGKNKMLAVESRCESRSPLLDCSLCGATVRIWDFLTVPRPARFAPNNIDIPDTSKKMALTRGASAASGVSGWVAADDMEKEQTEDRDEVATTNEGKLLPNTDVDLNLTMAGGLSFTQMGRTAMSENMHDADMGRDLMIGQPSGSEVGDRAASYESRGPSSRKRSLEIGASSDDRPHLRMQQADSIEGTVIDRDGDEVTDGRQYSAGPSKRARDSDIFDTYCSPYNRDSSGAGPSHSLGFEIYADANKGVPFRQGSDQVVGISSARDSTRASSVIAMDTIGHSANENSMESVENYPGDIDDVQFPSSSIYGNLDMNDTSEMNYSNQAQQSICFQPAAEVVPGEMGVSSTNDGEEIFNAEIVTAQARDGFSFGISGGSVGMCASHEAEIHGTDISVHRADSVVGDVEPRTEDAENQGQTGESAPGPGLMDEIVPEEMNREDPHGDSQEMLSQSVGRADSGSKIDGSAKAESVESGEKIGQSHKLPQENNNLPSFSCNAIVYSGQETSKPEPAHTPLALPQATITSFRRLLLTTTFHLTPLVSPKMMTIVRAPQQPPPPRESPADRAFQEAVDRFLATKNQPFTVSGTIPTSDPLSLFFQTDNGTSYNLRLPLEDEFGTSPAFDALISACEPEERFVPPARTDSAPPIRGNSMTMPTPRQQYSTFTSPSSPMVGPGAVIPAGTVLYPSPPTAANLQNPSALVAGQFIPPHRRSLVYPSGRPLAVSMELSSHPVLDIVKATLFPKLPQGYHLLAVRDKLHVHPAGTYTRPVHDAVFPEGVVATIMVTLPVHYRGGTLVIGCEGKEERFYGRLGSKANELEWQAWRTNCDWEVQKVEKGHRVALTWHVYQRSYGPSSHPLMVPNDALLDALADLLNYGRGKNLGFFLSHEYGVSPSDVLADSLAPYLKGADAILYHAVKIYKLQPQLRYCAGGYIWPVDKPALIVDSNRGPQSATPFKRAGRSRSLTRDTQLQVYQRRQEYEEDADLAEKVQRGGAVPLADENITLLHSPEQGHIAKERVPFLASDAENTLDHLYVNVVLVVFIP